MLSYAAAFDSSELNFSASSVDEKSEIELIVIFRGLSDSGISRVRSICNKPFSRVESITFT